MFEVHILVEPPVFLVILAVFDDEEVIFGVARLFGHEHVFKFLQSGFMPFLDVFRLSLFVPQRGAEELAGHVDERHRVVISLHVLQHCPDGEIGVHRGTAW